MNGHVLSFRGLNARNDIQVKTAPGIGDLIVQNQSLVAGEKLLPSLHEIPGEVSSLLELLFICVRIQMEQELFNFFGLRLNWQMGEVPEQDCERRCPSPTFLVAPCGIQHWLCVEKYYFRHFFAGWILNDD